MTDHSSSVTGLIEHWNSEEPNWAKLYNDAPVERIQEWLMSGIGGLKPEFVLRQDEKTLRRIAHLGNDSFCHWMINGCER